MNLLNSQSKSEPIRDAPFDTQPFAVQKQYAPSSNISTFWAYSNATEPMEDSLAISNSVKILNQLDGNQGRVSDNDLVTAKKYYYQPHVSPANFKAFYKSFNELQGHRNTFWVSGLNNYELVELVMRNAKDIVDSYF